MAPSTPEESVRRTLAQYAQLCDEGRFDEWADLFTEDARFHVMGRTVEGRAAIQEFISGAQGPEARAKHALLHSVIDVAPDGRTARAWVDFVFVDRHFSITQAGRYHDELVAGADGRWRFTLREIVFLFEAPVLASAVPGGIT